MWVWGVHFAPCRLARMVATWLGVDYLMGLEAVMHASCTQHLVSHTNIDKCGVVLCNASSLDVDIRCQRESLPQNGKAQMIPSFRTVLFLIFYIQISCARSRNLHPSIARARVRTPGIAKDFWPLTVHPNRAHPDRL